MCFYFISSWIFFLSKIKHLAIKTGQGCSQKGVDSLKYGLFWIIGIKKEIYRFFSFRQQHPTALALIRHFVFSEGRISPTKTITI